MKARLCSLTAVVFGSTEIALLWRFVCRLSMDPTHLLEDFHALVFLRRLQVTCRDVGVQLFLATQK